MDDQQRLQLSNMIKANNVSDQTDMIRKLKHSALIREDVNTLVLLRAKHRDDPAKLYEEGVSQCNFLFSCYTDIFNKIRKDELDIGILHKFIDVLRRVELGELDQHEGAFAVGTLLKELYVDSAVKKADKLEEERRKTEATTAASVENKHAPKKNTHLGITWNKFKKLGIHY